MLYVACDAVLFSYLLILFLCLLLLVAVDLHVSNPALRARSAVWRLGIVERTVASVLRFNPHAGVHRGMAHVAGIRHQRPALVLLLSMGKQGKSSPCLLQT